MASETVEVVECGVLFIVECERWKIGSVECGFFNEEICIKKLMNEMGSMWDDEG